MINLTIFLDIKNLNKNIEKLTEAIQDFNKMTGEFLGYKVTYEEEENKK